MGGQRNHHLSRPLPDLRPRTVSAAGRHQRIVSGGFPFYDAGDALTPTLINLTCFWLFKIPLSYILGRSLGYGPPGMVWAMALAFSLMSVVSALLCRRGRWKRQHVQSATEAP